MAGFLVTFFEPIQYHGNPLGPQKVCILIQERPWDLQPRVILLRNLMKQGLGRERDVPWLAIQALQQTGVEECDISSECYVQVLQAVLVGLRLVKLSACSATCSATARVYELGGIAHVCFCNCALSAKFLASPCGSWIGVVGRA